MSSFLTWLKEYAPWILGSLIPSIIVGLSIDPRTKKASGIVQKVLDCLLQIANVFSVATYKNSPGTFKLPLHLNKLTKKKAPPPAPTALVLLTMAALGSSSCYCWQDVHASEPKCVVVHDTVDCTAEAAKGVLPAVLPIITSLLATGTADWSDIVNRLKIAGFKDGGCLLAALQEDLLSKPQTGVTATNVKGVSEAMVSFKMHFNALDTKFCVEHDGKKVCR